MPTRSAAKRFPTDPERRVPTQDRSRQRVERILDAAARTFADVGFDAATTEAIAERAGTSIGSVYQFFPNKRALFDAIAKRYLDRSREVFDRLMSPDAIALPWHALLDGAVDAFASLEREDVDIRAIWMNWHLSSGFYREGQALNREFARRAELVLRVHAPGAPPEKLALVSTVIIEVMSAMLFLATRSGGARGAEIVAETKVLLRRYLEPLVTVTPTPRAKKSAKRARRS